MERYDNTDHVPKFLSCEHTFCLKCLNKLSVCLDEVECPVCRTKHRVPPGMFATNRALLDVVDELEKDKIQTSVPLKCSEHKDTECVLVCIDCLSGLCPKCLKQSTHNGHHLDEMSEAKAVLKPAFEKQVKEEQAILERMLSMINDSKHSVTELTNAESNMAKIYDEVDKIIVSWKKDQLLQLGSCKQVSITQENKLQTERGLLQSLLEQNNIDIETMIAKLKSNGVQKEKSLNTITRCLDAADCYNFQEQTQSLIGRLQSVFSNQELVASKVLKPLALDVKPKASPTDNKVADTKEDNKHLDTASANTKTESSATHQFDSTSGELSLSPSSLYLEDEDEYADDEYEDEDLFSLHAVGVSIEHEDEDDEDEDDVETDASQDHEETRNCTFTKVVHETYGLIGQINNDIVFYTFRTGMCELCPKNSLRTVEYRKYLSSWKDVRQHHRRTIETMREFYLSL